MPLSLVKSLSGYKIHVPRSKEKGGGVAVILKSTFSTKQEKVTKYTSFEMIELSVVSKKDSLRLSVLYRPPSSSKTDFPEQFQEYLDSHNRGKLVRMNIYLRN